MSGWCESSSSTALPYQRKSRSFGNQSDYQHGNRGGYQHGNHNGYQYRQFGNKGADYWWHRGNPCSGVSSRTVSFVEERNPDFTTLIDSLLLRIPHIAREQDFEQLKEVWENVRDEVESVTNGNARRINSDSVTGSPNDSGALHFSLFLETAIVETCNALEVLPTKEFQLFKELWFMITSIACLMLEGCNNGNNAKNANIAITNITMALAKARSKMRDIQKEGFAQYVGMTDSQKSRDVSRTKFFLSIDDERFVLRWVYLALGFKKEGGDADNVNQKSKQGNADQHSKSQERNQSKRYPPRIDVDATVETLEALGSVVSGIFRRVQSWITGPPRIGNGSSGTSNGPLLGSSTSGSFPNVAGGNGGHFTSSSVQFGKEKLYLGRALAVAVLQGSRNFWASKFFEVHLDHVLSISVRDMLFNVIDLPPNEFALLYPELYWKRYFDGETAAIHPWGLSVSSSKSTLYRVMEVLQRVAKMESDAPANLLVDNKEQHTLTMRIIFSRAVQNTIYHPELAVVSSLVAAFACGKVFPSEKVSRRNRQVDGDAKRDVESKLFEFASHLAEVNRSFSRNTSGDSDLLNIHRNFLCRIIGLMGGGAWRVVLSRDPREFLPLGRLLFDFLTQECLTPWSTGLPMPTVFLPEFAESCGVFLGAYPAEFQLELENYARLWLGCVGSIENVSQDAAQAGIVLQNGAVGPELQTSMTELQPLKISSWHRQAAFLTVVTLLREAVGHYTAKRHNGQNTILSFLRTLCHFHGLRFDSQEYRALVLTIVGHGCQCEEFIVGVYNAFLEFFEEWNGATEHSSRNRAPLLLSRLSLLLETVLVRTEVISRTYFVENSFAVEILFGFLKSSVAISNRGNQQQQSNQAVEPQSNQAMQQLQLSAHVVFGQLFTFNKEVLRTQHGGHSFLIRYVEESLEGLGTGLTEDILSNIGSHLLGNILIMLNKVYYEKFDSSRLTAEKQRIEFYPLLADIVHSLLSGVQQSIKGTLDEPDSKGEISDYGKHLLEIFLAIGRIWIPGDKVCEMVIKYLYTSTSHRIVAHLIIDTLFTAHIIPQVLATYAEESKIAFLEACWNYNADFKNAESKL